MSVNVVLELPPEVAALLERDADARRRLEAVAAAMFGALDLPLPPLTPDDLGALHQGLSELDAGNGISGELAFSQLRERVRTMAR